MGLSFVSLAVIGFVVSFVIVAIVIVVVKSNQED